MKTLKIGKLLFGLMLLTAFTLSTVTVATAQNPQGKGRKAHSYKNPKGPAMLDKIPGLTQTQKEQIKKLHTALMKDIMPLQNNIGEKRAHLRTLSTAEKPDMKAINSLIDEIFTLKATIQKKRMKFMQDVRALLTDEQRVMFDQHSGRMMKGGGKGCHRPGSGYHR